MPLIFKKSLAVLLALTFLLFASMSVSAEEPNEDTIFAGGLAGFISWLFVPPEDYFITQISEINDAVNSKLGGLAYLYQLLNHFFKQLNMSDSEAALNFELPKDFFFDGYAGMKVNTLSLAMPFVSMLKSVANIFICISTAIACYHKIRSFFSE